ncbi:MAG: hypothetical protein QXK18_01580 [Candidatus Bathyarchaeia archaeon]
MVNAVYDHIIAILVICVMFVGAVVILPTLSAANIKAVDQQQLRNIALNVFNTILLDAGEPVNWGSFPDFMMNDPRIKRFGLASAEDTTFYVLDPDKVQRLIVGNPLNYCDYNKVRELLGLQGYGFRLRIIPPFNVTNVDGTPIPKKSPIVVQSNQLSYSVKVSHLDGTPIPNALVYATIVYTSGSNFGITSRSPIYTNALGICNDTAMLNFAPSHVVVVLRVTVAEVATLIVTFGSTPPNDIAKINFVGDEIILTMPDATPRGARWVDNIIPITNDEDIEFLYNGTRGNDDKLNYGALKVWSKSFNGLKNRNPVVFIFNFWAVIAGEGRQEVLIAGPYQNLLGYTVFEYGGAPQDSTAAVKIQRSVIISGMTYTAELWLWKESP